ncbi:MAG: endonuclease MutS2 [Rhodothermales bacterium]
MTVYPRTADEKLGFDTLRATLADLTKSRLGDERITAMKPLKGLDAVRTEVQRVAELQNALRFDDPVPLHDLLDVRSVLRDVAPKGAFVETEALHAVRLASRTVRLLTSYLRQRNAKYPMLADAVERVEPLKALEDHIARVVDDEGHLRDNASPDLQRIRRQIQKRQNDLRNSVLRALRMAIGEGYATEEQPTIRGGRMVIPIRAEAKRKVQGFVHDMSASGQTVYIEPAETLDLNNEVRQLEVEERHEIERILREVTGHVRHHREALAFQQRVLSRFDVWQAKARLANQLDATVPDLNADGIIDIRDGRHPVLLLRFAELNKANPEGAVREVVPLDLKLGEDFRTLVITGPNAGGKSVAMKTVGLFALMLSYGLPIPADPLSRFSIFDRLIVDIGDEQSMEEDLSTFSSHVKNLKYMLQRADAGTLILIDEAGTGTDPAEGGALAQAVLEYLTDVGARTVVTTHHGTLKVFAHETEGVENGSMQFDQATLEPTYRFQPGIPGSSYAFDITQRIGLRREVVKRARALVGEQKTALESLIVSFERRNREAEKQLTAARKQIREAESAQQRYEERRLKIREERENLRKQALREAEQIVSEANAQVERTIREIKEAEAARDATQTARAELETFKEQVTERRKKTERKQRHRQKKQATPAKQTQPQPSNSREPIDVGDQVVVDDGSSTAEVMEIDGKEAVLALGSMTMRVKLKRLTKVGGPKKQQVTVKQVRQTSTDLAALRAQTRIDVRGQRVDEAMLDVTRLVDEGHLANLERVEILHGKGTGALRHAIRDYLATRHDIAHFEDAEWEQGGPGVTVVHLATS